MLGPSCITSGAADDRRETHGVYPQVIQPRRSQLTISLAGCLLGVTSSAVIMSNRIRFAPRYADSWAVVVGINAYANASPLGYAANDAKSVASALGSLGFPKDNTKVLLGVCRT